MANSNSQSTTAIVIVDDDQNNVSFLSELIQTEIAAKIFTASSGHEASQLITKIRNEGVYSIDAIVSDIQMPGMSGHEFLLELVSNGIYAPVIFVSGYQDLTSALKALRLSAFDYFSKPIDVPQFLETLQIAISKGQRLRAMAADFSSLQVENLASKASEEEKKKIAEITEDLLKQWRMSYLLGLRNSKIQSK
jgi:DNA-binding NtrC family response regulator